MLDTNRDCTKCGNALSFLYYKGKSGTYCSNACFEAGEGHSRTARYEQEQPKGSKTTMAAKKRTTKKAPATKKAVKKAPATKKPVAKKVTKKPVAKKAPSKKAPATKKPVAKRASMILGSLRPGTPVAEVARVLLDGKAHTFNELWKVAQNYGANPNYPADPLLNLNYRGQQLGGAWEVRRTAKNYASGSFTLVIKDKSVLTPSAATTKKPVAKKAPATKKAPSKKKAPAPKKVTKKSVAKKPVAKKAKPTRPRRRPVRDDDDIVG